LLFAARISYAPHEENASGCVFANEKDEGGISTKNRIYADRFVAISTAVATCGAQALLSFTRVFNRRSVCWVIS